MTLSLRVGGASTKPTDTSPSPTGQRFASNSCDTTKITYEFFNELIENFTIAQASYAVTNVPNDANALKKLLDSVRTGGYAFTTNAINTSNNNLTLGTGKLFFTADDNFEFNDTNNEFSLKADGTVANSKLNVGNIKLDSFNVDTIAEKTTNTGVTFTSVARSSFGQFPIAFAVFDGAGTILKGFNVSSVTKISTGLYDVNFTNALPNVNACVVVSVQGDANHRIATADQPTTGKVRIISKYFNGDNWVVIDGVVSVVIYGF